MHEAEGGQGWQHVPPESFGRFIFVAGGRGIGPPFSLLISPVDKVPHVASYFSQTCFCLATCGLVLPAEIPWWVSSGIRQPSEGRAGSGDARHSARLLSKVVHFNKAPPIPFLKGIDYVLLKWALNLADPSPVGHFRVGFVFYSFLDHT